MAYSVQDIANKILFEATKEDAGGLICNLKLQKMLYYMQGFYLAYFDKPLFEEEIQAWVYGPVIPSVYKKYKKNGREGIAYEGDTIEFKDEKEERLFYEVYNVYNEYSAIALMRLTHSEHPWRSVTPGTDEKSTIKASVMKKHFKKQLKK